MVAKLLDAASLSMICCRLHDLTDIVLGNNGDYNAGPGYDLCTGLPALQQHLSQALYAYQLHEVVSDGEKHLNDPFHVFGQRRSQRKLHRGLAGEEPACRQICTALRA